jgi:hypothetical protein
MTPSEKLIADKKAERERAGLKVTLIDTGWNGYFATAESRDEFVARARAQGRPVMVDGQVEITLADLDAWKSFADANRDAIEAEYETLEKAFRHTCDGGLVFGGGAAPLFIVTFAA